MAAVRGIGIDPWRACLALTAGVALLRLAAVFLTPLQLYPDEAQYWLWTKDLAFGYVSKPPMIAWMIAASTALGGDGEAWVRLPALLCHTGAALALFKAGERFYGPWQGLLASALWTLAPGVLVSAAFMATDAPLALFLSLALWAYAALLTGEGRARVLSAAALGAALGAAFLSKQAALYFAGGLVLHALLAADARRAWRGWRWAAALGVFIALITPNLAWQAQNDFATVAHTTEVNAHFGTGWFKPLDMLEFIAGQFGVLGPVPFAVLLIGAVLYARRRAWDPADLALACLALPPILVVTVLALVAKGRAHWAAAAYPAAMVLIAAWLIRWRARRWTAAGLALQAAVAAVFLAAIAFPALVDGVGLARRLDRIRGWDLTAAQIAETVRERGPFTAVVFEDRYLFNEVAYYGGEAFAARETPPLRYRPPDGGPLNQAELAAPLTVERGGRVLIVEATGPKVAPKLLGEFDRLSFIGRRRAELSPGRFRDIDLYVGEGYRGPARD